MASIQRDKMADKMATAWLKVRFKAIWQALKEINSRKWQSTRDNFISANVQSQKQIYLS